MGRRNYCMGDYDPATGEVQFTVCVEKSQGSGTTKEYVDLLAIAVPAPHADLPPDRLDTLSARRRPDGNTSNPGFSPRFSHLAAVDSPLFLPLLVEYP